MAEYNNDRQGENWVSAALWSHDGGKKVCYRQNKNLGENPVTIALLIAERSEAIINQKVVRTPERDLCWNIHTAYKNGTKMKELITL